MVTSAAILNFFNPALQSFPGVTLGCCIAFMVLLMTADWVSDAMTTFCLGLKLDPLFVGLVMVGALSALPELAMVGFLNQRVGPEAAIGSLIGGGWLTLAVPLGVAALKMPLGNRDRWVSYDLPLLVVGLAAFTFLCMSGLMGPTQGWMALACGFVYLYTKYHFGKESRYGMTAFGGAATFGASTLETFLRLLIGLALMLGCAFYLSLAIGTVSERLSLPALPMGFTAMIPFVFPEVAFALSALRKGHSELILGQGLSKTTTFLLLGAALLGLLGAKIDPNITNFIFPSYIIMLITIWGFARTSSRLWKWQGGVILGLTAAAIVVLWSQGYHMLTWIGLPKAINW